MKVLALHVVAPQGEITAELLAKGLQQVKNNVGDETKVIITFGTLPAIAAMCIKAGYEIQPLDMWLRTNDEIKEGLLAFDDDESLVIARFISSFEQSGSYCHIVDIAPRSKYAGI